MSESLLEIDKTKPWAEWPSPNLVSARVADVELRAAEHGGVGRLLLFDAAAGDPIGFASREGLHNISTRVGFPMPFVEKLPLELQAAVINDRMRDTDEREFLFTREPFERVDPETGARSWSETELVTNIAPGRRGVLPHAAVAQRAFNVMASVYGDAVEVAVAKRYESSMQLRLLSPESGEVAPGGRRVGDVLQAGMEVSHSYGVELSTRLFARRLVCLNGMTSCETAMEWKSQSMVSAAQQLEWLLVGVAEAIAAFPALLEQSRKMALTPLDGDDVQRTLIERARAMRLPARHHAALLAAWREEPSMTEWGALNAFTRLASHGDVRPSESRRIAAASGQWASGFDMITARLPRPMAEAIGAFIIEDEGGSK